MLQYRKEFESAVKRAPDALKLCMTDTQPPPPAAELPKPISNLKLVIEISSRLTVLLTKLLLNRETDEASTVPIAPPHAEQAVRVRDAFGQVAVLPRNEQPEASSEPAVMPIAPPV